MLVRVMCTWYFEELLDELDILLGVGRKRGEVAALADRTLPALECRILDFDILQYIHISWQHTQKNTIFINILLSFRIQKKI